ncbi:MAG: hypothetical protein IKE60_26395 [Reyranella sp.]|uniref:phage adaptor protein n=1 Tax=Reyranella sp. TaxID=1929291 RepID=UPI0025F49742|nr:hypothetical protein [Reyranella sp.]MBR2818220.1 hypothetical protein [Reyranella sp.]
MQVTNYTTLIDALAQYLNRRDLTSQIPAFVVQAEAKLNRELATARVREMMTLVDGTTTTEFIPLPADFITPYTLELRQTSREPIEFITEERAREIRSSGNSDGRTRWFTIFGSNIELIQPPTGGNSLPYRLRYFQRIPALATADVNWLITKSPDLYVVSSALEASLYLKNDERIPTWNAFRSQIIEAMRLESEQSLKPQGALFATRRTFG